MLNPRRNTVDEHRVVGIPTREDRGMLLRLKVMAESVDPKTKTFQARDETPGADPEEVERIAGDLETGVVTRFYRGGQPHGRVVAARRTADGLWMKIRMSNREPDIWKLVETGAVNTVEIQTLPKGIDVFLKSVAATYPARMA